MKRLAVLGATGSIGQNALKIAAQFPDRLAVRALSAHRNIARLAQQIEIFKPDLAAVCDGDHARQLARMLPTGTQTEIVHGEAGYCQVATHGAVDTVLTAVVGAAGLQPTLAAIEAGKEIALANKETLVMAGEIVMAAAQKAGVSILPVDSEHSAIFQCLQGQPRKRLARILLTASGGPFREMPAEQMATISPQSALAHPTWQMGPKITIDSATLMNKGLEVIEAKHLFAVSMDRIEVVVHPQSIVHSMVAYVDGSVMAQMGVPDMRGAIAYAFSYPDRWPVGLDLPQFSQLGQLTFETPDSVRFPCLALAYTAGRTGGVLPAVLNAANEVAVDFFLNGRISFVEIPRIIEEILSQEGWSMPRNLQDIVAADQRARALVEERVAS